MKFFIRDLCKRNFVRAMFFISFSASWHAAHADINMVTDFAADPTGSSDSSGKCQSAVNSIPAGGTIFFPRGTYRFTGGCIISSSIHITGEGQGATTIKADLSTPFVFQLGTGTPITKFCNRCSIERLSITRAPGNFPTNVIAISAEAVDYDTISDVDIGLQGFGIRTALTNPQISLGLMMDHVRVFDSRYAVYLNNIAEVKITDSEFGRNGIETVAPVAMLSIVGATNGVWLTTVQFIPRVTQNTATAIAFSGIPTSNPGYYRFMDINAENVQTAFSSDASTARITELFVSNSRIVTTGALATLNAATQTGNWDINNTTLGFSLPTTFNGTTWSRFLGNFVYGPLTFNGGSWIVSNNTFIGDSTYSGYFSSLVLSGNHAVFDSTVPFHFNITGTGKITVSGNGVDSGTPPADRPQ